MSQYDTIYAKVSEMICDAKDLEPDALTPDTTLPALELDSLDYVELMVLAKREFSVTLTAEMFIQNPHMTLQELCQTIEKQMAG
ncbi:acyl carrier protein [Trabulsiella odontotermitis]|uniref:Acyl carrier protein n=1 Tax=Trabulsiella odontotermitis TaxID=379893 RepID=A0A0L0H4J5_9ENTR|nr:acyl carrier protein [Trabulsiella odontotermitis]KNC90132.1 acyl carrier protein [Trabulsiella odontotermitis]KNC95638.1 acyl carrier protein [Trabulsiella odontotermitis]